MARFTMKALATRLVDALIVLCLALAGYVLAQPSSPVRVAWVRHQTQRKQERAAARMWPQLLADASPLGRANAEVDVIEIADFGCPFCRQVEPVVDSAIQRGLGVAYLNYPLPIHQNAEGAALAAVCAQRTGEFRQLHDQLFRSARWQTDANWMREALSAGIKDTIRFSHCLSRESTANELMRERALGDSVFVQGTPTFVARGAVRSGTLTLKQLMALGKADRSPY